jgi:hypothetical protein
MTARASSVSRKRGSACDLVSSLRVVAWQAGGMGVIYEVLLRLRLLGAPERRDRLPFGEAEQARVSDSGDG